MDTRLASRLIYGGKESNRTSVTISTLFRDIFLLYVTFIQGMHRLLIVWHINFLIDRPPAIVRGWRLTDTMLDRNMYVKTTRHKRVPTSAYYQSVHVR